MLGDRAQPEKKKKKSKKSSEVAAASASHDPTSDDEEAEDDDWTLSDAVRCEGERHRILQDAALFPLPHFPPSASSFPMPIPFSLKYNRAPLPLSSFPLHFVLPYSFSPSPSARYCQHVREQEDLQLQMGHTPSMEAINPSGHDSSGQRRHLKPDSYFSDEDASDQECM